MSSRPGTLSRQALFLLLGVGLLALRAEPLLAQGGPLLVTSPESTRGQLYRGQLHCHSARSDGKQAPLALGRAYRRAGYDFVALSDHRRLTLPPPLEGLTWLPASELNDAEAERPPGWGGHRLNALSLRSEPGSWNRETLAALLKRLSAEEGTLVMANHPRLRNRGSGQLLARARPLHLISIFNGRGYHIAEDLLEGSGSLLYQGQDQWDALLARGRWLWGVAADDCHDVSDPSQFHQGWVEVRAASPRPEDLLEGLRRGSFIACRAPDGEAPPLEVSAARRAIGHDIL